MRNKFDNDIYRPRNTNFPIFRTWVFTYETVEYYDGHGLLAKISSCFLGPGEDSACKTSFTKGSIEAAPFYDRIGMADGGPLMSRTSTS